MKHLKHLIILVTVVLAAMVSCKKESSGYTDDPAYLKNVKAAIKDSMRAADYEALDFSKIVKTHIDSGNITLLRIAFKQKSITNDFVLLQTNENGDCLKGRIVAMNASVNEKHKYNGSILITGLQRNELVKSAITNGYVEAFLPPVNLQRTDVLLDPYVELPEVVVVGTYYNGGISLSTWYSLLSFLNDYDYGGGYGYYNTGDPYGSGGGGGGNGNAIPPDGGNPVVVVDPIFIDFDNQYSDPAIELEKYLKCFTNIPDAGAAGSIEIFTDIPVNGDPTKFFDWSNGSPGHTFIQLRKQSGSQSVSQNIGFYPSTGWKTAISPAPIDGKWVDNQGHEFNASYKIDLTAAQVQTAVTRILYLSHFVKYDIDEYNCTDWALDVFNQTVSVQQRLEIPKYDIPGGEAPYGTNTPQGLYVKLQQMQAAGGSQATGITIPLVGWVGQSGGPCN